MDLKMNNIDETVIVDDNFIILGQSGEGGWNKKQFEILGISWPPPRGWRKLVIGKIISYSDALKFIEYKRVKNKKDKNKIQNLQFVEVNKKLSFEEQYKHPNWQRLRLSILTRDNFTCKLCSDNQSQLHVHHLKYDKNKMIWDVKQSDLITLCDKCHRFIHNK